MILQDQKKITKITLILCFYTHMDTDVVDKIGIMSFHFYSNNILIAIFIQ